MKISETCMKFREESILDHPRVTKQDPGQIEKKSAGRPMMPADDARHQDLQWVDRHLAAKTAVAAAALFGGWIGDRRTP